MTATSKCAYCGQANLIYADACSRCGSELTAWRNLPPEVRAKYTCWKCGGRYTYISHNPNKGTGCIIVVLGIIFAPLIIGIFLIVYGVSQMNESVGYWQCRSCGLSLPG